jgi:hypothetical protein
MRRYLSWSLWQFYLLIFWPSRFGREVEDINQHALKRRERLLYLLKMLPWLVALPCLGNLITGNGVKAFGTVFNWDQTWIGVALGVMVGVACGVTLSVAFGVSASMTFGVTFGVAFGLSGDMVFGVVFGGICGGIVGAMVVIERVVRRALKKGEEGGLAGGDVCLWLGIAGGVAGGVALNVAFGVAVAAAFGIAAAVAIGVPSDGPFGVTVGAALGVIVFIPVSLAYGVAYGVARGVTVGLEVGAASVLAFWLVCFRLAAYPLDVTLATVAYLLAYRWCDTARTWRLCPVAWNEVIWLPLPFSGKLLALLAHNNRDEGLRQIAFVAAERRLQRRVTIAALVQVAIDDLRARSVSELANVTDKLDWTTDAPTVLPTDLAAALPRFDRVAQHVGQYLSLHNAYRKSEALSASEQEIDTLQRGLIAGRGRYVSRLLQVANEWRQILEEERAVLPQASREIPNPFAFGNPIGETEHSVFTGRRDIAQQIEANLLGAVHAPTLLLHGPRRMGKTSLLNQLPRLLGPDCAPTVVDCQNPAVLGSPATLLRYLSRAIADGLRRRRVTRESLTAAALEREPFAAFDEWLDGVERAMPGRMRVLLCLDEYERLQATLDAGWGAAFLDALRHTLQHRPRVALMFTGSHTFAELGPAWTDRFISARRVRIGLLTRDEVIPLLTRPIPEFDMTYAAGALEALIDATNGQPFLTQAVAFELVQLLNEHQRKEATPGDIEEAIARALVSGGEYFANVWSDAGAAGQAILRAVARGETPPEDHAARSWLREHDVLTDAGTFVVPMVERWVRQKTAHGEGMR